MTIASLSSGGTATNQSAVNCEDAVRIGKEMQKDLDDESPVKSMKTSNKCKNLAALKKKVKLGDKKVYIEKTLVFSRLIIMAERMKGSKKYSTLNWHLFQHLSSLWIVWWGKPQKHEFGRMLKATTTKLDLAMNNKMHVVDGGWLLHQIKWIRGATIKTISYCLCQVCWSPLQGFYCSLLMGKKHHWKVMNICGRWLGRKFLKTYRVTPELTISCDREVFLANEKNKGALIMTMSAEIANQNILVCQAKDDADTLIVKTAMDLVTSVNPPVVVVAQDTDILVLLCYHRPSNCSNLYLPSDAGGLYDISTIAIVDWEELLFKHGWSGNDSFMHSWTHQMCSLQMQISCLRHHCIYKYHFNWSHNSNSWIWSNVDHIRLWVCSPWKGSLSEVPEASIKGGKSTPTAYHQRKMQQHSIPFVHISKLQYGSI